MAGTVGEQKSLDHIYSFSDARCSFPKAAEGRLNLKWLTGKTKWQNYREKSMMNEHLEGNVKDMNR